MLFVKIDVDKEINKRLAEDEELRAGNTNSRSSWHKEKKSSFLKIRGCQLRHPLSAHLQKLCRRHNFRICNAGFKEIFITGQQYIGFSCNSSLEYQPVRDIAYQVFSGSIYNRSWNNLENSKRQCQEAFKSINFVREFPVINTAKLFNVLIANYTMIGIRNSLHVCFVRGALYVQRCRDKDIGIYQYPHSPSISERTSFTNSMTSSSVRIPAFSASPSISFCSIFIA